MIKRWLIALMLAVILLFFAFGGFASATAISVVPTWSSGLGNWDWSRSKLTANFFNGDAFGDVAILYNYGGDSTGLWLFTSTGSAFNPPLQEWNSGPGNWDWNRSKMVSGNFVNNDAYRDVVVFYDYGGANTGLWLFEGTATGFNPPVLRWSSGPGNWDWNRSKIVVGKFDGDNYDDIAVLYDYGGSATGLWTFRGAAGWFGGPFLEWSSGPGNWDWNRSMIASQDFYGDGYADVAVFYDYGDAASGLWTFNVTDTGFSAPSLKWSSGAGNWDWNRSMVVGAKFWSPTYGNIGILYDYGDSNTGLWTFQGPSLNSPQLDWSSGPGNWDWNRSKITATDTSGLGLDEFAILYDYGDSSSGFWWID